MEKMTHESVQRLFEAAKKVRPWINGAADLARALNQSEQTINNWQRRPTGVSKQGRLIAQKELGISATWIEDGSGDMLAGNPQHKTERTELGNIGPSSREIGLPKINAPDQTGSDAEGASGHPLPLRYSVSAKNFRRVFAVGRAQGGLPERVWTDGDYPVGATDEYAEIATSDPHAFLVPVVDVSMVPRYNPGEFAFVEPGTAPEAGDDVLVRLATGETMIKKLTSQRAGMVELESYNKVVQGTLFFRVEEITWMYYIAHPVPARKIKTRM